MKAAGLLFFGFAGYARIATLGEEVRDPARPGSCAPERPSSPRRRPPRAPTAANWRARSAASRPARSPGTVASTIVRAAARRVRH
jgi:hypothetical protein